MEQKSPLNSIYVQALIVFAVAFAAYLNSIGNGFVYDDKALILDNPWVKEIKYIPIAFISDSWAFIGSESSYYRPLMNLYYTLDYQIFGPDRPWGFHLTYVLFHSTVSVSLLLLAVSLFNAKEGAYRYAPLAAALIFATHPINTQVVAWNGVHEMSMALFSLLSLHLYIRGRLFASLLAFIAAAFSKETGIVVPLAIVAWDLSSGSIEANAAGLKKAAMRYLPYAAAGAAYLALRSYALGGFITYKRHTDLSFLEMVFNVPPLFAEYLIKLAVPVGLTPTHVFDPARSPLEAKVLLSLAAAGAFIFAAYRVRKNRLALTSMALICAPLLPVMYLPAMEDHAFAENYLYLPSAGFSIVAAAVLCGAATLGRAPRKAAAALFTILIIVYVAMTVTRNPVWKDDLTLWSDAVRKSPRSYLARNNLGATYSEAGRLEEARHELEGAIAIRPSYARAHYNLGLTYSKTGDKDKAIDEYLLSLRYDPNYAQAAYNLALIYHETGRTKMAEKLYEGLIALERDNEKAHNELGLIYFQAGRFGDAVPHYKRAVKIAPDKALYHSNLGSAYGALGRLGEAIMELQTAVKLDPSLRDAAVNLSFAYAEAGMAKEAREAAAEYMRVNPDDAEARALLEKVISKGGEPE